MDANGSAYHLLLGAADWTSCRCATRVDAAASDWQPLGEADAAPAEWDARTQELRLRAVPFDFAAAPADQAPGLARRRGVAGDRYGNWYAIDTTGRRIRIWSEGGTAADFWPPAEAGAAPPSTAFTDLDAAPPNAPPPLCGLAVTTAHFLVVGTLQPPGLLVFDLYAGGAPRHLLWPAGIDFRPFDLAAGPAGATWVLDRDNRRCWWLDASLAVQRQTTPQPVAAAAPPGVFGALASAPAAAPGAPPLPAALDEGAALTLAPAIDPIAIDLLPDGTLVVLDAAPPAGATLHLYRGGQPWAWEGSAPQTTLAAIALRTGDRPLVAHDLAVLAAPAGGLPAASLFVADAAGNQAYRHDLHLSPAGRWRLQPQPAYLPLRRFGGKGLASGGVEVRYDFADAWVPLVEQPRARYVPQAALHTRAFDGKQPQCVWHRVLIDACIPPETVLRVRSRADDDLRRLPLLAWNDEPLPMRRPQGSELPFVTSPWRSARDTPRPGEGTWELLLQGACGRWLELMIEITGQERATPRLRALRIYYPRFSYLAEYLPAVYRDDSTSASLLDRLLANFEGMFTAIEDRIAAADVLLDWRTAPPDALAWLAGWVGAAMDPAWDESRQRLFVRHARLLFRYRGTAHGLKLALALALDAEPDPALFDEPEAVPARRFGVRVVDRFHARSLPDVLLGDPSQLQAPADARGQWKPADGAAALHARYSAFMAGAGGVEPAAELPLVPPADAVQARRWALFTESVLGFTPWAATLELQAWQAFLEHSCGDIERINEAWLTAYEGVEQILQFTDMPSLAAQRQAWQDHMRAVQPARTPLERRQWQDFLRSRHGAVSTLNDRHGTAWTAYDLVPLPDRLPADGAALQDWFQFEGGVLAISGAAHRFRVLLPMPTAASVDVDEPQRRLDLAQRIVELGKPAHTRFDLRFYWAMFRVGEARLGLDTLIDNNAREQLMPAMVLGRGHVGETRVGSRHADAAATRTVLGARRLPA